MRWLRLRRCRELVGQALRAEPGTPALTALDSRLRRLAEGEEMRCVDLYADVRATGLAFDAWDLAGIGAIALCRSEHAQGGG